MLVIKSIVVAVSVVERVGNFTKAGSKFVSKVEDWQAKLDLFLAHSKSIGLLYSR